MEAGTPTYPDAGVMATSPATAPVTMPSTVGFPRCIHSMPTQVSPAMAAAVLVTAKALDASPLADRALPALNPNHPNHSSDAPITVRERLCGGSIFCG